MGVLVLTMLALVIIIFIIILVIYVVAKSDNDKCALERNKNMSIWDVNSYFKCTDTEDV
jgi:uncharacterized protein (UPF0333 family)